MAYIDRDKLLFVLKHLYGWTKQPVVATVMGIVNAQPTIEIKQAHWEIDSDGYYPYCSECRYEPERPVISLDNRTPYCPNCGAEMRKEDEGK